ncbi:hypothetical protein HKX48_003310, partial [Thoreauomyces humboldtii]
TTSSPTSRRSRSTWRTRRASSGPRIGIRGRREGNSAAYRSWASSSSSSSCWSSYR